MVRDGDRGVRGFREFSGMDLEGTGAGSGILCSDP
jgi:hypothetical protein